MEDECQTNLLLEIGKIRGAQAGRILRGFAGFHRDLLLRFMQISLEGFLSEISNQSVVPPTSSIFEPRSPPYRVSTFGSLLTRYLCETSNLEVVKKNEPNLKRCS